MKNILVFLVYFSVCVFVFVCCVSKCFALKSFQEMYVFHLNRCVCVCARVRLYLCGFFFSGYIRTAQRQHSSKALCLRAGSGRDSHTHFTEVQHIKE